jgi:hypothetical protein
MRKIILPILILAFFSAQGQKNDSLSSRNEIIGFNLSSHILYTTSFIISYEHVLKNNNSFAITAGYLEFPNLILSDSAVEARGNVKKSGYTIGAEYRFYLKKQNKYAAPHGVYIGPYASYYHFMNVRDMVVLNELTSTDVTLTSKFNIVNLGFQLGYQFIFNDRWSLDMIFAGPSLSLYGLNISSDVPIDVNKESEIVKALIARFPMLDDFIDTQSMSFNKANFQLGPGYRYLFKVGYKFGLRKKK